MNEEFEVGGRKFEIRTATVGGRTHVRAFDGNNPVSFDYSVDQETAFAARQHHLSFDAIEVLRSGVRDELRARFATSV